MVTKNCLHCQKEFRVPKCREYSAKYCSVVCRAYGVERNFSIEIKEKFKRNLKLDNPKKRREMTEKATYTKISLGLHKKEKNSRWAGGIKYLEGYRLIYVPEHPNAVNGRYVREHRLVMEKHIGRYLKEGEDVHHINGNKLDNRIENLQLMSKSEHTKLHQRMKSLKVLNFTCVDILPALLDKTKEQTIRPAWDRIVVSRVKRDHIAQTYDNPQMKGKPVITSKFKKGEPIYLNEKYGTCEKPARFKVGDEVKLMWNQRSKYTTFWKRTGLPVKNVTSSADVWNDTFRKHLGNGVITEVFKIEMGKNINAQGTWFYIKNVELKVTDNWHPEFVNDYVEHFAKFDGFVSADAMFKYFDANYDLAQPRRFWAYRWKWL